MNGYRSYDRDALVRLRFVQHAQAAGLTLREISQVLAIRSDGRAPCVHVRGQRRSAPSIILLPPHMGACTSTPHGGMHVDEEPVLT
jgi:DNA-binding transcriptional MerR regulator